MEVSASATVSYLPMRSSAQRPVGTEPGVAVRARGGTEPRLDERDAPDPSREQAAQTSTRAAVAGEPLRAGENVDGFRFEYEDNVQVMKVQDSKGVLIYQVPSKGRLALIEAEQAGDSARLRQTA